LAGAKRHSEATQLEERHRVLVARVEVLGVARQRLVELLERFLEAAQVVEGHTLQQIQLVEQLGMMPPGAPLAAAGVFQGNLVELARDAAVREVEIGGIRQRLRVVGIQRQRMLHRQAGVVDLAQGREGQAPLLLGLSALGVLQERLLGAGQRELVLMRVVGPGRGVHVILVRRTVSSSHSRIVGPRLGRRIGRPGRGRWRQVSPGDDRVGGSGRTLTPKDQCGAETDDPQLAACGRHLQSCETNMAGDGGC
jgi:hypothetical protein